MPYRIEYYEGGAIKSYWCDDFVLLRVERELKELKTLFMQQAGEHIMASAQMQQALDELRQQVEQDTTVTASAVTLIQGLVAKLEEVGNDPAAVRELTTQIKAQTQALAAAVDSVPHPEQQR